MPRDPKSRTLDETCWRLCTTWVFCLIVYRVGNSRRNWSNRYSISKICFRSIVRDSDWWTATNNSKKWRAYFIGRARHRAGNPNKQTDRISLPLNWEYFMIDRGILIDVDGYRIEDKYRSIRYIFDDNDHGCFRCFLSNHKFNNRF